MAETLARRVCEEQKANQWPGLVEEAEQICRELSVESFYTTSLSAKAYRAQVLKACHIKNEERLKTRASGGSKCDRIMTESYGKKDYVSSSQIQHVREVYKTRFAMNHFAGNFSRDRRFARTEWLCHCGKAREEESHLIYGDCEVYGEIRDKFDNLNDDENLVKFFNQVLAKRDLLDGKE